MKRLGLVMVFLAALGCGPAFAQAGFYLPTINNNAGQDEFRAADGTTCRTTMDGAKRLELGSFATQGRPNDYGYGLSNYNAPSQNNTGVYGRFSMSLDASPGRIDCNKLYRLEIERRELELELMKRSLQSADRRLDEQMGEAPIEPAPRGGKVAQGAVGVGSPSGKRPKAAASTTVAAAPATAAVPAAPAKPRAKVAAARPAGFPPP